MTSCIAGSASSSSSPSSKLIVGYYFPAKKVQKLTARGLFSGDADRLTFVPLSFDLETDRKKGIDLIFTKLADEMALDSFPDAFFPLPSSTPSLASPPSSVAEGEETLRAARARIQYVQNYCKLHPSVEVVEPLAFAKPIIDRWETHKLLRHNLQLQLTQMLTQQQQAPAAVAVVGSPPKFRIGVPPTALFTATAGMTEAYVLGIRLVLPPLSLFLFLFFLLFFLFLFSFFLSCFGVFLFSLLSSLLCITSFVFFLSPPTGSKHPNKHNSCAGGRISTRPFFPLHCQTASVLRSCLHPSHGPRPVPL